MVWLRDDRIEYRSNGKIYVQFSKYCTLNFPIEFNYINSTIWFDGQFLFPITQIFFLFPFFWADKWVRFQYS